MHLFDTLQLETYFEMLHDGLCNVTEQVIPEKQANDIFANAMFGRCFEELTEYVAQQPVCSVGNGTLALNKITESLDEIDIGLSEGQRRDLMEYTLGYPSKLIPHIHWKVDFAPGLMAFDSTELATNAYQYAKGSFVADADIENFIIHLIKGTSVYFESYDLNLVTHDPALAELKATFPEHTHLGLWYAFTNNPANIINCVDPVISKAHVIAGVLDEEGKWEAIGGVSLATHTYNISTVDTDQLINHAQTDEPIDGEMAKIFCMHLATQGLDAKTVKKHGLVTYATVEHCNLPIPNANSMIGQFICHHLIQGGANASHYSFKNKKFHKMHPPVVGPVDYLILPDEVEEMGIFNTELLAQQAIQIIERP